MSDPIIKIQNMNKWFGDFQVLKNINLEVEANKKIVVCGPSGSGKLVPWTIIWRSTTALCNSKSVMYATKNNVV